MRSFLDTVIHDGWAKLPMDRYEYFLRALHHSVTLAPETYTSTSFEPFGFTQRELYDLRVVLLRPLAFEFVQYLGADITRKDFDKRTGYAAYQRHFGREPWLISIKPRIMLLSYTEWLELGLGDVPDIPLPDFGFFD